MISKGDYSNLNLVLIGAVILLFGWFEFNSGGALASGQTAAITFTNIGIAAGFATVVWVIISYVRDKSICSLSLPRVLLKGLLRLLIVLVM